VRTEYEITELPKDKGYWYLGTCYSKWPHGINDANAFAQKMTGRLFLAGVPTFSPIAHTHGIALASGIDPFSHAIFMPLDKPMVEVSYGGLIAEMPGWKDSKGVQMEIAWFRELKKPLWLIHPVTLRYRPITT
jgi:hypothetical protein